MNALPILFTGHFDYLLQEVLESIEDGVLVFNKDNEVVYANPGACKIYGKTMHELLEKAMDSLVAKDHLASFKHALNGLDDSDDHSVELTGKHEFRGVNDDGHVFSAEGKIAKLRSEMSYIMVLRDVTWRNAVEQELETALSHVAFASKAMKAGKKAGKFIEYRLEHPAIMDSFRDIDDPKE